MNATVPAKPVAAPVPGDDQRGLTSLTRRLIGIAAVWIAVLLLVGGYALDRVLTNTLTANFDEQLSLVLRSMFASAEIDPDGEVRLTRQPADQRYLEAYSGIYFQVSGAGKEAFASPSLWDRRLKVDLGHRDLSALHRYDSNEFADEPLRVLERDAVLPGSPIRWRFQVAHSRTILDEQLREMRSTLAWSLAALGIGLLVLTALQAFFGLWPLRRVRSEVIAIRTGRQQRIAENFPREVYPLVHEINQLLAHGEEQAEEARRHAGNLAHALKTPLTVITNAATAQSDDLADTVCREATTMRRQVDHHLARARAIGRRSSVQARATVWTSAEAVQRAVDRMYEKVTVDLAGDRKAQVRVERQDLDELLGNLIENAAKYGGGRVFVTIEPPEDGCVAILIEDDGPGIPEAQRADIFARGKRLDTTGKPGTGLGLAIVSDVAEIYAGKIALSESDDLGGLLVTLSLPAA